MPPFDLVPATLDRIAGDIAHTTARLGRIAAAGGGAPYLAKNGTVQYAGTDCGTPGQPLPADGYS
ncbi:hypothetical protein EKD04_009540 [Chloroflexales bacterium ZM16-3]|nr:hypothetical protein [Chloroflexales bacterium ZM16-3]